MDASALQHLQTLLEEQRDAAVRQYLLAVGPERAAELIDDLDRGKRKCMVLLPPEVQVDVLRALSDASRAYIVPRLPAATIARLLHFAPEDEATDILQYLEEDKRGGVLQRMQPDRKRKIETLLAFGSETAGGLMDLHFIVVDAGETAGDVLRAAKRVLAESRRMPAILVADAKQRITGVVPSRNLLFTSPEVTALTLQIPLPVISHQLDRERVIEMLSHGTGEVACVVNDDGQPLGVVHLHDLLKVAEEEATEDVYRFAGVAREEHALSSVLSKVRLRYLWLILNLGTAFLASFVVSQFQSSIEQLALLAVFMPIVAGEGGNTATQSLAVVVRGLAMGEIDWFQARPVIAREAVAGMLNGIIVGTIAAGASQLFGAPPMLGLVLGLAVVINMLVAGFFGSLVPFVLKRLRVDPAVASCIFVTTATDICGFLAFLGLGTLILL